MNALLNKIFVFSTLLALHLSFPSWATHPAPAETPEIEFKEVTGKKPAKLFIASGQLTQVTFGHDGDISQLEFQALEHLKVHYEKGSLFLEGGRDLPEQGLPN